MNKNLEEFKSILRGEIYLVDLSDQVGSEQGGVRPAVVMQNNEGNRYAPTTIVCPLTSQTKYMKATHVILAPEDAGLVKHSTVLCEQVRTIDKSRIKRRVAKINNPQKLADIEKKIMVSFGITGAN